MGWSKKSEPVPRKSYGPLIAFAGRPSRKQRAGTVLYIAIRPKQFSIPFIITRSNRQLRPSFGTLCTANSRLAPQVQCFEGFRLWQHRQTARLKSISSANSARVGRLQSWLTASPRPPTTSPPLPTPTSFVIAHPSLCQLFVWHTCSRTHFLPKLLAVWHALFCQNRTCGGIIMPIVFGRSCQKTLLR